MSLAFRAVQWNRAKLVYDTVLLTGVTLYIGTFVAVGRWWLSPADDPATWEDLTIRAFGTCAFLMLTIILSIGPLARLDRRLLPMLYNRRHFGVLTFLVASVHGWVNIDWFVSRGKWADFLSIVSNLPNYGTITHFPYDTLGLIAIAILFLMAATSHDFWLQFFGPSAWKALHMAVYVVYGALVMHVALGVMQSRHSLAIPALLGGAATIVASLHLTAAWPEWSIDRGSSTRRQGWIVVGPPLSIPDGAARIVTAAGGERIAVFRDGDRIGALTNLCAHQNGPLGEGRIIDGCAICPWHGYQYRLEDGCAPPPYTEKLATYRVRIRSGMVEVEPHQLPLGTRVPLARLSNAEPAPGSLHEPAVAYDE
jgi:nitrite reductase/ring-hydroxylating ferredoxin subunit/DMSO/TMAO reductase YedYZ heme-binding membrane subunit